MRTRKDGDALRRAAVLVAPRAYTQQSVSTPDPAAAPGEITSQEDRNKALVLRFYEEALHNDKFAYADAFFAPDYIRHDASDSAPGVPRSRARSHGDRSSTCPT